ncbi:MAG: ABC transporter ATP-binding protein, partial [Acidimicrobiales bacterium]
MMLEVRGLTVVYEGADRPAVDGLDLDVGPGEVVAVLGPSGCGKSTLLRAVAGLVPVERGTIALAGRDLAGVATHERGVGLMFQDYALFPHRDVGDNVAFGLRMRGVSRRERDQRVAELLELVGLPGAERRPVAALSGGERQRVALARAVAPAPSLLMLDEPLGALDRALRDRLVIELGELFGVIGVAVLYVTHDQGEALGLAHRVVVMDRGRVVQQGPPADVWARPASAFVARFLGLTNLFDVAVVDGRVAPPWGGTLAVDGEAPRATLLVRPEGISLTGLDETGSMPARVTGVMFAGGATEVRLELEDHGRVTALV